MEKLKFFMSFFAIFFTTIAFAQTRTVTGTVTDDAGDPAVGATVRLDNTGIGDITDVEGRFSMEVPDGYDIITVSYIGMKTEKIDISDQSELSVQLSMSGDSRIEQVVITGVGEAIDKRRTAIDINSVDASDLNTAASGSVDEALIGKVAGATLQSTSGQPGQQTNIILRGINSLGSTNPLIMIDGVEVSSTSSFNGSDTNSSSRLADLDLSNVERVEVIKGAAAGTIYGAQGANGVIQIFTKKGGAGKAQIDFGTKFTFSEPILNDFKFADLHAFQEDANGMVATQNSFGVWSAPTFEPGNAVTDNPYQQPLFDQLDDVFSDNPTTSNTRLAIRGGTDKMNYAVAGSYFNQESPIFKENNYDRYNGSLNLGFNVRDDLVLNFGVRGVFSENDTGGITGANDVNSPLGSAFTVYNFIDFNFRNAEGNFIPNPSGDNSVNPLYTQEYRRYAADVRRVMPNANINYKPFDFLELDYKYGIDYYNYDFQEFIFNQENINLDPNQGGFTVGPEGRIRNIVDQETQQNSILSLFVRGEAKDVGIDLPIQSTTMFKYDWRRNVYNQDDLIGTGLPLNSTPDNVNINQANEPTIRAFGEEFVTYGFLFNQRFEYDEKLGISAGIRSDKASVYANTGTFLRGDFYTRISEFDFFEPLKDRFSEFKFRAAYGEAGIQPPAGRRFDNIITLTPVQIGSGASLSNFDLISAFNNPNLILPESREFEIGTDLVFHSNSDKLFSFSRLNFTYWDRQTFDVIETLDIALSAGGSGRIDNGYDLEANGFDISWDTYPFENDKISWNFITNFGRQTTKIKSIANGAEFTVDDNFVLSEGDELGSFRGFSPLTSLTQTRSDGSRYISDADLGNYEIVPESGYVVNSATQQVFLTDESDVIGSALPDFTMNFINNVTFNDKLNLRFQIDWIQGMDVYNRSNQWAYRDNISSDNQVPVTIGGQSGAYVNYYQSLYAVSNSNSHFVENGSFVRLRNAFLSYKLEDLFQGLKLRNAEIFVQGNNLFTITDYSGFDPEAASNFNDPLRIGLDQYAFPNSRAFHFGINLGL